MLTRRALLAGGIAAVLAPVGRAAGADKPEVTVYKSPT
jgi:hypothetical protein